MDRKKVTSRDVAEAAGVSQSLVSLILNNVPNKRIKPETRELVISTAKKLNYKVNINARNMKSRRAGAIGLLSEWRTNSFVFPPVIDGAQSVCTDNEIGIIICTGKEGTSGLPDYIEYYMQNRIDGLLYVSYVGVTKHGVINKLEKNGIPFVCIIGARDLPGVSCVDVSFLESGYLAVKHLAENGYKKIAYIHETKPGNGPYAETERFEGCAKAADDYKLKFEFSDAFVNISDERELIKAANGLLASNKYDSIISTSYKCHIILKSAAGLGIEIPKSLGVISLDNELYAPYLYPPLTTIDEPLFDISRRAATILMDKIQGHTVCEKIELNPLITVRESTSNVKLKD